MKLLQRIKRALDKGEVPEDVRNHPDGYGAILAYLDMITEGVSPKMAEMLTCKQAPGTMGVERTTSGGLPYGALAPAALRERQKADRLMRLVKGKRLI